MEKLKYTTKSETDRVFSVFDTFKQDAEDTKDSRTNDVISAKEPVLTMSSLGQFGRFGNQLFQYAFLRICAKKNGARVESPPWIGQTLFGHKDAPISKRLPPAIESCNFRESLFEIIPEFIPYLEKLADAKSSYVGSEALEEGLANVDIWGFFQLPTHLLAPYKEYFRSLFQPVQELKIPLVNTLNILRSKGKTIIGIHLRRGDYIAEVRASFTLVFPAKWYCEWLDEIWENLEEPILFLCSDDIDSILPEFEKFSPVTSRDLDVNLPEEMKELNIEFYIDFFMLSNCDIVCISNSVFSFAACMLNEGGETFIRPHWDFSTKFIAFDPWNSEPLLRLGGKEPKFFKSLVDILYVTYITQGIWIMLKSIFIYVPKSRIKGLQLRAYLGYQIQGILGIVKSLLYTLGWDSLWKKPGLLSSK
ncbi:MULTISPECIES: alpha-1,2-fucosyltransferase [unclassified Nostoc]|uniref:alpha-1,2-fucosyltransferase n=1 Tax=unclassified Nostoc TaxID=2593658 RepID=UPI0025AA419F|nr:MULTISPECIES: alpha-1,2-fucosyltransferase [unclassified Nostoc]MDM9586163.1 alpha-1,2-fucosyltransferase [Nostoc sp. GT001]MDZ7945071.1 alpha-1,2-fucosyltransferase [Nostoc sp. EfeVER01]MDZ7990912.1 alpha-1,2-fucosyltransferase [Nostoc sp. EspVER01]